MSLSTMLISGSFGKIEKWHIAALAEHGFARLEIGEGDDHFDWYSPSAVAELSRWLDEFGVRAHTLHLPFRTGRGTPQFHYLSLSEPYEAWRREAIDAKVHLSRVAADLGCPLVVEHGPGDEYDEPNGNGSIAPLDVYRRFTIDQARDTYRRSLEEYWERTREFGLRVALENVMTRASTVTDLLAFCREFDQERFGICVDIGHAHVDGDVLGELTKAGSSLVAVHMHDNDGSDDQHLVPGEGSVDWPGVMRHLKASPWLHAVTLEVAYHDSECTEVAFRRVLRRLRDAASFLSNLQ
ncbi:MAG: sugar phosphate isomerase/epimerase family protein [Candidatus Lernaella stagnicola]|nr:sugar phosphate isomerase/epimerase family protein [Candidatus Lernaella stagnicola]